jgi:hypothetical protein
MLARWRSTAPAGVRPMGTDLPVEQRHADARFHLGDGLGDRGLGDAQAAGGGDHAAGLADGEEHVERAQVEGQGGLGHRAWGRCSIGKSYMGHLRDCLG